MITSSYNYYVHKLFSLLPAVLCSHITITWLLNRSSVVEYVNGQAVEASYDSIYPFILGAIVFDLLFLWIVFKYFRVSVDENGIEVLKIGRNIRYEWNEIMFVSHVHIWKGAIFKVETVKGSFYIHADSPSTGFKDVFNSEFQTEMGKVFKEKKVLS